MTTAMRLFLLVLVAVAVAAGIGFGIWLWDVVTSPDEPLSLALAARSAR
jgi:nitrate reductase NapE component